MILNPLQRIQIVESNKKFKPGSIGYFVAQETRGIYNQWALQIVFTRFGKKGKPRVEPAMARTRVVEYDNFTDADKKLIRIIAPHHNLDPTLLTSGGGRRPINKNVKLKTIPIETKDVLYLPDNEFMAYIMALSMFIHKIMSRKPVKSLSRMYADAQFNGVIFERHGFDLGIASPESLARYLIYGIEYDIEVARGYRHRRLDIDFSEAYKNQTDTIDKKRNILNGLRRGMCMAKNGLIDYEAQVAANFLRVQDRISHLVSYYKDPENKQQLIKLKKQLEN